MGDLSENFSRSEFACKCGCGFDTVDYALIEILEKVRGHFNQPVTINSGCRCPSHNKNEGGSERSQHLLGRAADIAVRNTLAFKVAEYLISINAPGIGEYSVFSHVDTRSNRFSHWVGS